MIPEKSNLPAELLELKQFILWFEEKKGEKLTKVPAAPWKTGHWKAASATDPENWTSFDTALEYAKQQDGYGIGFAFKEDGGVVGIDLDKCVEDDKVNRFASDIIRRANSYTELSPSGLGVHIFMRGNIADKVVKDDKIEIYHKERYFTLTGKRCVDTTLSLNSNDDLLGELFEKFYKTPPVVFINRKVEGEIPIVSVIDMSLFKKRGKQFQGTHPIHGSETGMNFAINEEKNVWHCFRHGTGGGPLSLLGILRGIIKCEDCVPGRIRGEKFKKILATARVENLAQEELFEEEKGITDKYITDRIIGKYQFYCDKHDENTTLYIWEGTGWSNGVAEGIILNELSGIFKDEERRQGMTLERTVNFIKGQAMNLELEHKPPHIIPFVNGLYNLTTGELNPHNPSLFYTNVIPHKFDQNIKCPKWEKWIREVIREEDIPFVQEWLGYQLYDSYPEPGFVIFIGKGQNGKSIFLNIKQKLIGERNVTNVALTDVAEGPYALAELYQKLANISDDISNRAVRNSGPLKMISSGSYIEARQIYGKHFGFKNYAKPTYACNEPPEFRDESDAIKYRLKAVEFPWTFKKNPDRKNEERLARDRKEIEAELEAEIPGIINWALEGLKRLAKNNFTFTESRSTEETWEFYKRKSNPVLCFLEECLEFTDDPIDTITKNQMYQNFTAWLKSRVDLNVSRDLFFKRIKALGVETTQSREYDRQRVYIGIKCHSVTSKISSVHLKKTVKQTTEQQTTGKAPELESSVGKTVVTLCQPPTPLGGTQILSQWDKAHIVMAVIAELEDQYTGAVPIAEVYVLSLKRGIGQAFLDVFIDEEKRRGVLYEPKMGCVSRAVKGFVEEEKSPPETRESREGQQ